MTGERTQVLIVEDDPVYRSLIRHVLVRKGIGTVEAATVATAAEALATETFGAVLLDYELPDGKGLDLLEHVDRSRTGRLILVTGIADRQELDDPRASLVDAYLTKPFSSAELLGCVEDLAPNARR